MMKKQRVVVLTTSIAGVAALISTLIYIRTGTVDPARGRIIEFAARFYALKPEDVAVRESPLSIGDPGAPVRIIAFTDFICPACFRLYEYEKRLASRFWGKIRIDYYNFPLDRACNERAQRSTYPNSCVAAKAFIAAANKGLFTEILHYHYEHYRQNIDRMRRGEALISLQNYFTEQGKAGGLSAFLKFMRSPQVELSLYDDIELAGALNIRAVPTIFINGRRLEGAPDYELLEYVISKELKKD
ncbi:MAG: hypothetical protein A2W19_14590 [Spirochaetes bacterium RBG_16_49_21]|nr:MAG: hypothetical protein A2W19_14590 [Spirochaetes bacterium RBG_16_49_21]